MKFRRLLILCAAFSVSVAASSSFSAQWYAGVIASNNQANAKVDITHREVPPNTMNQTETYHLNINDTGYAGGLLLGFWVPANDILAYGVALDFSANGSPGGESSGSMDAIGVSGTNSALVSNLALRYQGNLAFQLLFHMTKAVGFYIKAGFAFAQFRYLYDDIGYLPQYSTFHDDHRINRIGWMFGAGVNFVVASQWSLFFEYNRSSYGSEDLPYITNDQAGIDTETIRTLQDMVDNTFKIGFAYTFSTV